MKKYQSVYEIRLSRYDNTPVEVLEKSFIMNFFSELPLEKLKKLVNFAELNPYKLDKNLFMTREIHNEILQLKFNNTIKFSCELQLDGDEVAGMDFDRPSMKID